MADVEFHDYSVKVKNALKDICLSWLEEGAGEIESQAKRNTRVGKVAGGRTKGRWKHKVNESEMEAVIGNTEQTAIWLEFGTGEYALKGDGRKGGWYILIGNGPNMISQEVVDAYHFPVKYGKDGKKYAYTTGMRPQRPFSKAYTGLKNKLKQALESKLQGGMK